MNLSSHFYALFIFIVRNNGENAINVMSFPLGEKRLWLRIEPSCLSR